MKHPTTPLRREDNGSPSAPPAAPAPQAMPARPSGFILLIVLGILILITILSVAYLRTMRQRTEGIGRSSGSNIGQAADSVVALALDAIAADMPVRNSGQEAFDFPWTDASASLLPASLSYPVRQAGLFTRGNPARDDAWLASSYPDDGSSWNHLTNLTGSFLKVTASDLSKPGSYPNPTPSPLVPSDELSNNLESNVGITSSRLADADGDGIGDSLQFYPPKSLIGNTRYVAAAYIEDLSAKINLNTALPLRAGGGVPAYASILPKAWTPADVDLAGLVTVFGGTSAEVATAIRWRAWNDATAQPWTDGKRRHYWGDRASKSTLTGEPIAGDTNRYTVADEIELRFHGGINDHRATNGTSGTAVPVMTPVESSGKGFPNLLRAASLTAITENTWSDTSFASPAAYLRSNPRRWVTTMSGDVARQIGLDGAFLPEELRYNLNIQNPAHFAATLGDAVSLRFFRGPDGVDGGGDDYAMPVGFQRFVPTGAEQPAAQAGQWLANLTDAKDTDNAVTRVPDGAGWWYGFEPLPLLSEVYMQRGYYNKTFGGGILTCCASSTGATSGGDTAGYAIELANPYQYSIKLTNVHLVVQPVGGGIANGTGAPHPINADLGTAATPLNGWATFDSDGDPVLPPGHRLILWSNGSTVHANNNLSSQVPNSGVNHAVPCGMVINDVAGTGLARVDLLCHSKLADGTGLQREPGAYSTITLPWLPNTFQERTADGAPPASPTVLGFRQVNGRALGLAAGINLLQCRPALPTGPVLPDLTADNTNVALTGSGFGDTAIKFSRVRSTATLGYVTPYHAIGTDTGKATLPGTRANLNADKFWFNQQTPSGQAKAPGDQFGSLMDLLRVPMLGMRGTSSTHRGALSAEETTIASAAYELLGDTAVAGDANGGKLPLASLCVAINPGAQKYSANLATTSHKNVPFAWLLPCLCDTLNPAADGGLDVNRDGAADWFDQGGTGKGLDANANSILDWPSEVDTANPLIPGRLNLNTAPRHVLAEVLPITNPTLRADVAAKIVTRRNAAPGNGTRASATDRGLSSVFEVLQDAGTMSGFSGSAASRYDLVENLGCLPSVATCRSDFFAVHIMVQGFNANNFASGPIEQKRILVLVSRAGLTTQSKSQLKYWVYNY